LARLVGQKECTLPCPDPVSDTDRGRSLGGDVLERREGGNGDGADGAEHACGLDTQKGLGGGAFEERPEVFVGSDRNCAPEGCDVASLLLAEAAEDGAQECSGVAAPFATARAVGVGDQRAGQLVYVIGRLDLCKEISGSGTFIKGVQNDIAADRVVEALKVASIGIGDDGAVATCESVGENFAHRGGFAGAGGVDELEVLGFVGKRGTGRPARVTPPLPVPLSPSATEHLDRNLIASHRAGCRKTRRTGV